MMAGARHRYFPQQDDKELLSMPSRSTFSGNKEEYYGVKISGGNPSFDDETSSVPTSRLEKAIEENDSGNEERVMPRLQGLHKAYVQRGRERRDSRDWRDQRDWKDPGKGIFRTTEVSVTR
jgi:hypothetical protein